MYIGMSCDVICVFLKIYILQLPQLLYAIVQVRVNILCPRAR